MKGITYCGACADYDLKKHRCKRGAMQESNPQDKFFDDCPLPTVAPVVHSYWESYDCSQYMGTDEYGEPKWRDGKFYVCHNHRCRRKTVVKSHYCPNCGAKMDGAE